MRIEELDFELPAGMIAQSPAEPRDSCRLMRLGPSGVLEHAVFTDLERMLQPGDTLVFNDSKVLPARVEARKDTGGALELLFLRPRSGVGKGQGSEMWEVLARPSRRLKAGSYLLVAGKQAVTLVESLGEGRWLVCGTEGQSLIQVMERYGRLPLPPYIESYPKDADYQTVYARVAGSAAAPTAGLHFTTGLLDRLERRGVDRVWITLHVGLDTFLPIRECVVEDHIIHTESFEVPRSTVRKVKHNRAQGGRIVAVGTTSARVLETLAVLGTFSEASPEEDVAGVSSIFITPGYDFQVVDTLITNFHLPRSTVLALTMAFAGQENLRSAYREAIEVGYRFFSFGDAMLIEGRPRSGRVE